MTVQQLEGHTVHRYDGELSYLHMFLSEMGTLALNQTRSAIEALKNKDMELLYTILEREHDMDVMEVKVDNEIASLIARRGPVAKDLRVIMSMSKAVTDLERIGDEAARIANITSLIYDKGRSAPGSSLLRDIYVMGKLALDMLEEALFLFDHLDAERARELVDSRGELDAEFQSSLRRLTTFVLEDARNVGFAINVVLILKALERIGDHARNLAEYVVYLVNGEDVRHQQQSPDEDVDKNEGRD